MKLQNMANPLFLYVILSTCIIAGMVSGLSACKAKPEEIDLLFETIEQEESAGTGMTYEAKSPGLVVISRPEQVNGLNGWIADDSRMKLQNVDYDKYFVLAVFQGWKPSTGYWVEVNRVTQLGDIVNIYAKFHEPEPDKEKADTMTSPYQLVQVQKVGSKGKEITFNLIADDTVVLSSSHVIP